MLAAFLFIACFAAGVNYYMEVDSKQREWSVAKADLKAIESSLLSTQSQAATARQNLETVKEESVAIEILETSKKQLTESIAELRENKTRITGDFKKSVEKVRLVSIGTAYPEFTNGSQTIRSARIQKVGDEDVTFAHDEGIAKIGKDALPADLKQRFRIGMVPMLPEPPAPADPAQSAAMPVAAATPDVPSGATDEAKVAKLQLEIDAHEEKVVTLNKYRSEWLNRASTYRYEAGRARAAGRPAYTFNQQATQAEQNADAARIQIEQIKNQVLELRKKQVQPVSTANP